MTKFILKLICFLAALVISVSCLAAFVILANIQSIESCQLEGKVDSLIVGDSHTMWSIDDTKIPGLRNISLNAEGYKYSYRKLKYLLESGYKPKIVYIGLGYHNLSGYYDNYISGDLFEHFFVRYLPIMSLDDYIQLLSNNPKGLIHLFKKVIKEGLKPAIKGECSLFGRFPSVNMAQVYSREAMLKRINAQFYHGTKQFPPSSSNLEYLEKLIQLCRSFDVDLVMLNTPLHTEYLANVPEEYKKLYDEFVQMSHVQVYDFQDLGLSDNDFLPDGDHINSIGAILVTEKFKEYHERN